ncbi:MULTISPECIES: helix-turn-helix domain-containing protein [unclassified Wolbachia]|nr:helix-turn-helix transcriptional regulator [Wolbachia endosymbiont of Psylliodes chrysocephala]
MEKNIRSCRLKRGYTQKDLANKIGVSFWEMQRYAHTNNIIR